jgi:trk system potassium uptake protein TrkH
MNTFNGRFYSILIISYYTGFVVLGIALLMVLPILTAVGLQEWNPFWDFVITMAMFRRVVYNVLSAHTTTGFGSVYARQFALEWGDFGILILVIVMLIGGSACSTAGGFKGLRIGIIFNSILADVKRLLASERNVKVFRFHHIKDQILADGLVKASALIIICYLITFAIGTLIGTFCGYPLASAAFEAASITGNVGLSIGITAPDMPTIMKVYYIIAMYLGRLEFLSVFALIGFIIGGIKKCWTK